MKLKKETREEYLYRENMIKELLKDRPDLLVKGVFRHSYEEVKQIYEMEIWQDERYKPLLSPFIWLRSYKDICNILSLPEWNDPRFSALFHPTIWKNSYKALVEKLKIPYLYDKKYDNLIFTMLMTVNCNRIVSNFKIFEAYHIVNYINAASLIRSPEVNILIIEYLIHNNIPLVVDSGTAGKGWIVNSYLGANFSRFTKDTGLDIDGLKKYIANLVISPDRVLTDYDNLYSFSKNDENKEKIIDKPKEFSPASNDEEKEKIIIDKAKDFPLVRVDDLFKQGISYNQCLRVFNCELWNNSNRFLLTNNGVKAGIELVEGNLKLFKRYDIMSFVTSALFENDPKLNRLIIEYLISKNEPLVVMGESKVIINPLFDAIGKNFENHFGISYDELKSTSDDKKIISRNESITSWKNMSEGAKVLVLLKKWPYLDKRLVFQHNISDLFRFLSLPIWDCYENLRLLNDITISAPLNILEKNIKLFKNYNLLSYVKNEDLIRNNELNKLAISSVIGKKKPIVVTRYNREVLNEYFYDYIDRNKDDDIVLVIDRNDFFKNLRDRPEVICPKLLEYDIEEAIRVLRLPQWELPLFKKMLAPNIWNWSYREINSIIRFINLRGFKYRGLLVPEFWNASYEEVVEKLSLPCFECGEYAWLVTPRLFSISNDYISGNIEVYERYGISRYIRVRNLERSPRATEIVLSILNRRREKLVVTTKKGKRILNPIINCSNGEIKDILGIDLDKIDKSSKVRTR